MDAVEKPTDQDTPKGQTTHKLKCWPNYLNDIIAGRKNFELRLNDRDFKVGDILALQEFDPNSNCYKSKKISVLVTYILKGSASNRCLSENCCIMGIRHLSSKQ